jgi:hypothetical protein
VASLVSVGQLIVTLQTNLSLLINYCLLRSNYSVIDGDIAQHFHFIVHFAGGKTLQTLCLSRQPISWLNARLTFQVNNFFLLLFRFAGDDDKLSVFPPSTTGSLSSITTTSLVSEPGSGGDGAGSDRGDGKDEKHPFSGIKQEKWWQTTIQVSIPFFIAGIGTIGAGIILGYVEVSPTRSTAN